MGMVAGSADQAKAADSAAAHRGFHGDAGRQLPAPSRLVLTRLSDAVEISWAADAPVEIIARPSPGLFVGTEIRYEYLIGAEKFESDTAPRLDVYGGEPLNASRSTGFVEAPRIDSLVMPAVVEVFETDVAPQHLWPYSSDRYRIIWRREYEATLPR